MIYSRNYILNINSAPKQREVCAVGTITRGVVKSFKARIKLYCRVNPEELRAFGFAKQQR